VVHEDAILAMPSHGTCENCALDIPAETGEARRVFAVANPDHVLLDDRSGIELLDHVMSGGADQFDPRGPWPSGLATLATIPARSAQTITRRVSEPPLSSVGRAFSGRVSGRPTDTVGGC
jgi:hypothetical protein